MANYGATTDWNNEEKYLKSLAATGNAGQQSWANDQINSLNAAKTQYTYSGAADQSSGIKNAVSSQTAADVSALKNSYNQSLSSLNSAAAKIPEQYQAARNQTAASSEVAKQTFNEYAAASGLNSGAGGQAQLAQGNVLQGNLNSLNQSQADALSSVETQRAQLQAEYQNAVAQAKANNNASLASALIEEAQRVDASLLQAQANNISYQTAQEQQRQAALQSRAETQSAYGDFSGYSALGYTPQQITQMYNVWAAANPTLAAAVRGNTAATSNYYTASATPTATTPTASSDKGASYNTVWGQSRRMFDNGKSDQEIYNYLSQFNASQLTDAGLDYILNSLNISGYRE